MTRCHTMPEEPDLNHTETYSDDKHVSDGLDQRNHLQSLVIADLKFFGSTLDSVELYKHHKALVANCFLVDTGREGLPIEEMVDELVGCGGVDVIGGGVDVIGGGVDVIGGGVDVIGGGVDVIGGG
ncbi:hypothetical protein Tco_1197162, partial [Tanacetum coccineum]